MFIYQIRNLVNNKKYIGQTKNKKARTSHHKNALRNNKHRNNYLQRAWNKYSEVNFVFEIIECILINNVCYLSEREQWWINNTLNIYNIEKDVGMFYPRCNLHNPFKNKQHSKETKKKLSEFAKKRKGNLNSFYGKNHTEKSKEAISKYQKERLKNRENHPLYNSKIYSFYNKKSNSVLNMTQSEFCDFLIETTGIKCNSSVSSLINGKLKSCKGYKILNG